jgi:hypothetical protein
MLPSETKTSALSISCNLTPAEFTEGNARDSWPQLGPTQFDGDCSAIVLLDRTQPGHERDCAPRSQEAVTFLFTGA